MSIIGTSVAQSVAGAPQAERGEARARKVEGERPTRRTRDGYDTYVTTTDSADAVRRLASNDQEDAHEDRQSQAKYPGPPAKGNRHIDVQG